MNESAQGPNQGSFKTGRQALLAAPLPGMRARKGMWACVPPTPPAHPPLPCGCMYPGTSTTPLLVTGALGADRPGTVQPQTPTLTHTLSRYILRTHTHTHTHRHTDTPWPTTVRCRRRDKDTVLVSILVGSCRAVARDEGPGWRPDRQTTDGLFDTAQAVVMRPAGLCRALASVPSRTERT